MCGDGRVPVPLPPPKICVPCSGGPAYGFQSGSLPAAARRTNARPMQLDRQPVIILVRPQMGENIGAAAYDRNGRPTPILSEMNRWLTANDPYSRPNIDAGIVDWVMVSVCKRKDITESHI